VPQVGRGDGGVLELLVHTPEDRPAVPLSLSAGGRTLAVADVQGRRTVSVTVPRSALAGGDVRVALTSPAWTRGGKDVRARGVAVERVGWHPSAWMLPPARQLWLLPAVAAALSLLLLRIGSTSHAARIAPAAIGGLLALAAAWRPLEVAPFTHRLLIAAVLAHAALLLWAALVRTPGGRWWNVPREVAPPALVLLMAISYWTFVAYHLALCYETRRLCPTLATAIAGLTVLGGLVAAAGLGPPRRTPIALALVTAGGVVQAAAAAVLAFRRPAVDFATLWTSARDFSLGGPLYQPAAVAANHFGAVFKVPPFYGMLLLPFTRFELPTALLLDRVLDVALYLAGAAILALWMRPRLGGRVAAAAVAVVLGLMQPAFDTIAYGQIDIVLLGLMTLALLALSAGRPGAVGLAVALATLLKLYPLVLVLFLAARREWKAVAWTAGWLVALVGVAVAVMGWPSHVVYAVEVLPRIGGGTGWVENQTVNGFLCRLLAGARRPEPVHDRLVDLLTWTAFALVASASTLIAARRAEPRSSAAALAFGAFLVVMVLAVPAAWIHYETVTVLTFLLVVDGAAERPFSSGLASAVALAFGLVAYGNQWTFHDGSPRPGLTALGLSREFYGLGLLWAAVAVSARSRAPSGSRPPRLEAPA